MEKCAPFKTILILAALALFICVHRPVMADQTMEAWLIQEKDVAAQKLLNNINRTDTKPGTVVASPQQDGPNYYFHWVRDAALAMDVVVSFYKNSSGNAQQRY